MTAWTSSKDPESLVRLLPDETSGRRLRLFACACVRRHWAALSDERCRRAVEVAENFADLLPGAGELKAAWEAVWALQSQRVQDWAAADCTSRSGWVAALHASRRARCWVAFSTARCWAPWVGKAAEKKEGVAQAALVRCIFPDPSRPPPETRPQLGGEGSAVVKLARAVYEERILPSGKLEAGRLAILADALEEAGVVDAVLLSHLRSPGGLHVRGCFAVDAVLGRA
jgi:hypothetical protein